MLHWLKEGGAIRQGLNLYHPSDKSSAGFCLRIGNRMWRLRYSKFGKVWYKGYHKVDPKAYEEYMKGQK